MTRLPVTLPDGQAIVMDVYASDASCTAKGNPLPDADFEREGGVWRASLFNVYTADELAAVLAVLTALNNAPEA